MSKFDPAKFQRELRAAQRKREQDVRRQVDVYNREVDRVNRANHTASDLSLRLRSR